jgi:GTP 3',8-cyclase
MDPYGRVIDYLRISITDRCNERCLYCLPEGFRGWQQREDHLQLDEIVRLVGIAARHGFRKFRLTGGEPLVRSDVPELVGRMASIPGVECIGLSTNGTRLAPVARALRQAGLRTVNISMDALSPEVYRRITGGPVEAVLEGIRSAIAAGYECIKLNCVLMRGLNEEEIWPLILFASEHGLLLRLIELMPVTRTDVLDESRFLSVGEVMKRLGERERLLPQLDRRPLGFGPARYYRLEKTNALVGFIGAMTNLHFCESCNRVRLTADGKIRPCLGNHGEVDLREALRAGADDAALERFFSTAIEQKPREHQFRNCYEPGRHMTAIGG